MTAEFSGTATIADGQADYSQTINDQITSGHEHSTESLLEARGLCVDVAAKYGVTERQNQIHIEYRRNGKLAYTKIRGADARQCRCEPAGVKQETFWNEDCLHDDLPQKLTPLIITEGEPDALAVLQSGYQFVVSLPAGGANTPEGALSKAKAVLLTEGELLKPEIGKFQKIIVATDGDIVGNLLRDAIVGLIGDEYCYVPTYPAGAKDANDVLHDHGEQAVTDMIEAAVPVFDDGFVDFVTAAETAPKIQTCSTGLPWLDPLFMPAMPSLNVIGGLANVGKSTVVQGVLCHLVANNPNLRVSVFHAEGDVRIPVQRVRRFWKSHFNPTHINEAAQRERERWAKEHFAFVKPPQGQPATFDWLLLAMEMQAFRHQRNVFVLDCWNQIIHHRPKHMTQTEYICEALYKLKNLATRLGLMVFVVHHAKMPDRRRLDEPTTLYELSDSQHWANASDLGVLIWTPKRSSNQRLWLTERSKDFQSMGTPGRRWFSYGFDSGQIMPAPPPPGWNDRGYREGDDDE